MVNRVLIRLKTVQILYGYLLCRNEFKVETPVQTSSPDRRYSFKAYADLLMILLQLSGWKVQADRPIPAAIAAATSGAKFADCEATRFLMDCDDVRELIRQNASRMPQFDSAIVALADRLHQCSAYRTLLKLKKPSIADEITFWVDALRHTFLKTPELVDAFRLDPDFTIRGLEMGTRMLAETLESYSDTRTILVDSRRDLTRSLDKAYELYHNLLWLPVELTHAQLMRITAAKEKFLPTPEEQNPDMRFVQNKFVAAIAANPQMEEYRKANPYSWADDPLLIQRLLDLVTESEAYQTYMATPGEKSFAEDAELWREIIKNVITPADDIAIDLEEKSIFWNDDLDVMSSFAQKTIRTFAKEGPSARLLDQYKDDEDRRFGIELFNAAVTHRAEYRALIDEFINTKKWDVDRLALMDIVILITALAEVMTFPSIPLTVTANEYVEIANRYSTPRSGAFINGLLAAITDKLRSESKLHKNW